MGGNEISSEVKATGFVVEAGEDRLGGPLDVFGDVISVKISSRDTGGAFAVMEARTDPMVGPPLHRHLEQDEWWHVLEGEFLFEVDGQRIAARAGDTVFARRGTCHTFQNVGSTPGRTVVTVVPGGLDLFFEEVCAALPPGSAPDPVQLAPILAPIFEKYGLQLLGPPMAARQASAA